MTLEFDSQRQLDLARDVLLLGDPAEIPAGFFRERAQVPLIAREGIGVWWIEVDMVEDVESFSAELN